MRGRSRATYEQGRVSWRMSVSEIRSYRILLAATLRLHLGQSNTSEKRCDVGVNLPNAPTEGLLLGLRHCFGLLLFHHLVGEQCQHES